MRREFGTHPGKALVGVSDQPVRTPPCPRQTFLYELPANAQPLAFSTWAVVEGGGRHPLLARRENRRLDSIREAGRRVIRRSKGKDELDVMRQRAIAKHTISGEGAHT